MGDNVPTPGSTLATNDRDRNTAPAAALGPCTHSHYVASEDGSLAVWCCDCGALRKGIVAGKPSPLLAPDGPTWGGPRNACDVECEHSHDRISGPWRGEALSTWCIDCGAFQPDQKGTQYDWGTWLYSSRTVDALRRRGRAALPTPREGSKALRWPPILRPGYSGLELAISVALGFLLGCVAAWAAR